MFARRVTTLVGVVFLQACLVGCLSSSDLDLKRAKALMEKKKPSEAVVLFERVVERESDSNTAATAAIAANEAAKIYQYDLKRFDQAIRCYKIVIAKATDASIRREAQSKIAGLLFYDIQDFAAAVLEYSKLLQLRPSLVEAIEWRSRIAKGYYYLGDFFQARIEVDKILSIAVVPEDIYQAHLLKANIHVGAKEHEEAAKVLETMMAKFGERAKKDSIPLMLAVAFEEQRNFSKAIEVLLKVREYDPRKSFVDEKIKSLREREALKPGARGYRK